VILSDLCTRFWQRQQGPAAVPTLPATAIATDDNASKVAPLQEDRGVASTAFASATEAPPAVPGAHSQADTIIASNAFVQSAVKEALRLDAAEQQVAVEAEVAAAAAAAAAKQAAEKAVSTAATAVAKKVEVAVARNALLGPAANLAPKVSVVPNITERAPRAAKAVPITAPPVRKTILEKHIDGKKAKHDDKFAQLKARLKKQREEQSSSTLDGLAGVAVSTVRRTRASAVGDDNLAPSADRAAPRSKQAAPQEGDGLQE
jgi:hypothetical protein